METILDIVVGDGFTPLYGLIVGLVIYLIILEVRRWCNV